MLPAFALWIDREVQFSINSLEVMMETKFGRTYSTIINGTHEAVRVSKNSVDDIIALLSAQGYECGLTDADTLGCQIVATFVLDKRTKKVFGIWAIPAQTEDTIEDTEEPMGVNTLKRLGL
jgi:hypothetical protein